MGPHAEELINYICELSQESSLLFSPRDFASRIRDRISIALAKRAGALIQEGENRVNNATSTMSTARPSPSNTTPSTPSTVDLPLMATLAPRQHAYGAIVCRKVCAGLHVSVGMRVRVEMCRCMCVES